MSRGYIEQGLQLNQLLQEKTPPPRFIPLLGKAVRLKQPYSEATLQCNPMYLLRSKHVLFNGAYSQQSVYIGL